MDLSGNMDRDLPLSTRMTADFRECLCDSGQIGLCIGPHKYDTTQLYKAGEVLVRF